MSRKSYCEKIYTMARTLARLRGGSLWAYFADAALCSRIYGASPENYFVLRFFELSPARRKTYLTSGRSKSADTLLNAGAASWEKEALAKKDVFNKVFAGLVKREWLYAPDAGEKELLDFIAARKSLIIKPRSATQGAGVEKLSTADISDPAGFFRRAVDEKLLLEELITQHPALDEINPQCVNSLRINAARGRAGSTRFIGGALRCGGVNAPADNFHSGGVAYPVDMETGHVSGLGRDNSTLTEYIRHPGTLRLMPGFEIPFFSEAMEYVRRAMELVPGMGYVGWDIALTPWGPELIEGNFGYPGGNIIQLDGVGKYPLLMDCLEE